MKEVELDLSFISTEDLMDELQNRKEEQIIQAVNQINKSINLIRNFGVEVEHKSKNTRLLPNFELKTYINNKLSVVMYKDEEY